MAPKTVKAPGRVGLASARPKVPGALVGGPGGPGALVRPTGLMSVGMAGAVALGKAGALPPASAAALAAQAAARVTALEAALEANPYDVAAWEARIREAVQKGVTADASPEDIYERAVKQLPYSAKFWLLYADWAESQATPLAHAVYRRCCMQVPSLELWQGYLGFCKRLLPLEDAFRIYAQAVDLLGTDSRAGTLWAEYLCLLKRWYNIQQKKDNPDADVMGKLLADDTNPVEVARRSVPPLLKKRIEGMKAADLSDDEFMRVGAVLNIDTDFLRRTFQRAASSAHSASEKLWVGYEQLEKSLGNPPMAQKLLAEHMPRYVRSKGTYKEMATLCQGLDYSAVAVPITQKNAAQQAKLFEKWRTVLQFEQTNPLKLERKDLQARVTLLFQQAALGCAFHVELWHDFAEWLDLGGQRADSTLCLQRAVERFLPRDLTLRLLLCHRRELAESPLSAESMDAAEGEYRKLLDDMPKPCPLALINYLAFVRRQRGGGDFRAAFVDAAETSDHCSWEVYTFAAQTEYHIFGSTDAACKVFRLGLERYGEREPSLLAAYVNFLVSINDLRGARAELSKGVLDRLQSTIRDKMSKRTDPQAEKALSFLWQKWSRLERYFGDASSVRRCADFRDEEFRQLQRDQEVDEESVVETPAAFGLAMTVGEVEEGFRFQHLKPETVRPLPLAAAPAKAFTAKAPVAAPKAPVQATTLDQTVQEAVDEHKQLSSGGPSSLGLSVHIARPDVSKMLSFRPALDVLGLKKESAIPGAGDGPAGAAPGAAADPRRPPASSGSRTALNAEEERVPLPTMIPKCLQDLLAVLPARPLKGAKPDVDYLLTVLQTVSIPPIPVKELERFRYDSLRLLKEEDNASLRRKGLVKDELEADGFFSARPTMYRERLQAKRQRLAEELGGGRAE